MKRFLSFLLAVTSLLCLCACAESTPTETTGQALPEIMQKSDPSADDRLNVLLVGNSGCYYYVEELYGMLDAVGIQSRICNVYYSGCLLSQHYNWWQQGKANYEFFTTDENGRVKQAGVDLEYCLSQQNWDAISLREGGAAKLRVGAAQALLNEREVYLTALYGLFREQFPMSRMYWEENAAYALGYSRNFTIETKEQQTEDTRHFREFAKAVAEKYDVTWIPKGEANQIYRQTPGTADDLCQRLAVNNGEGDYYHDGDIGGGQYLTACVWFEMLTGQSCIGNTWRPDNYFLAEEKIQLLQQCAHEAVENLKAGKY